MRKLRSLIRLVFGFNRSQTNAFLLLLPLTVFVIFSQPLYQYLMPRNDFETADKLKLDSLLALFNTDPLHSDRKETEPFYFNPNTASLEEFKSLGFSERVSQRVINYRTRGGKFVIKKDLLKIHHIDTGLYHKLYAYIQLPSQTTEEKVTFGDRKKFSRSGKEHFTKPDLNTVDTTGLKKVYGIGSKLSARIIRHRESLGGFISVDQLHEIYGLDSAVIHKLKSMFVIEENFKPRSININEADINQLSSHPYVSRAAAQAIVTYRFQHGGFQSIQDLEKIQVIGGKTIEKITPYLTLDNK